MPERPTYEELSKRITKHLGIAKGDTERRDIGIAWDGYIAGLLEWGLLTVNDDARLCDLFAQD
jgi:hypothetical protein